MPGAYRDDREAIQKRMAELRDELAVHRRGIADLIQLQTAAQSFFLSKTKAVNGGLILVLGLTFAVIGGIFFGGWVVPIVLAVTGLLTWIHARRTRYEHETNGDPPDPSVPEAERIRWLQRVEATDAVRTLYIEQSRTIAVKERTCLGIEEEIAEMERMLGPAVRDPSPLAKRESDDR